MSWGVLLAKVPRVKRLLARAGVLTVAQAEASFPSGIQRVDVRRGLPFADGSTSYIYSSHMIEHMSRWQGVEFVRECRRVLAPGGVLRLATPDLALSIDEYVRREAPYGPTPADSFVEQLATFREAQGTRAQRLVRRLVTAPHQWLYDGESLAHLMAEGGLVDPRVRDFRAGDVPDLEWLEIRPGSLFVEARRKP